MSIDVRSGSHLGVVLFQYQYEEERQTGQNGLTSNNES